MRIKSEKKNLYVTFLIIIEDFQSGKTRLGKYFKDKSTLTLFHTSNGVIQITD